MGVSHEETLLEETSSREQTFISTISDLETELRSVKHSLDAAQEDKVCIIKGLIGCDACCIRCLT
jgi:hypothetical protein